MKNKFNNNQKIILIGIVAVFAMFILYNLFLSPYAQCVSGTTERYTSVSKAEAKLICKQSK